MSRQLIDAAIIFGNRAAFAKIAEKYWQWINQLNKSDLLEKYFARNDLLAKDFYCWLKKQ